MVADQELKRRVNRLTPADRFRLLCWLASENPDLVRQGVMRLGSKDDARILAWSINGLGDPATEGSAEDPGPSAAMG